MQPGIVQQQTADSTRPYLTSDEAATHLGLSKRTLENFRTHGGGPRFHKFGRKMVRYHRNDLAAWAEDARRTSTSQN